LRGVARTRAPAEEQARARRAADICALGEVVYALVTGRLPVAEPTPRHDTLGSGPYRAPRVEPAGQLRLDLPEPAEAAIQHAVTATAANQFTSAAALARAFRAGLIGIWMVELESERRPTAHLLWRLTPSERGAKVLRSMLAAVALVGLALLLVGGVPPSPADAIWSWSVVSTAGGGGTCCSSTNPTGLSGVVSWAQPTPSAHSTATPGGQPGLGPTPNPASTPSPVQTVDYPPIAGSYSGTVTNTTVGRSATMILTVNQNKGNIWGQCQAYSPLPDGNGPYTGSVDTSGNIDIVVTATDHVGLTEWLSGTVHINGKTVTLSGNWHSSSAPLGYQQGSWTVSR
jgi:hypothetical protein